MPFAPFQRPSTNQRPTNIGPDASIIKLTTETHGNNIRLAEALAKTGDFSAITPILLDAIRSDGAQAAVEINDLIGKTEARLPGHGQKLVRELGQQGVALQGGSDGGGELVQVDAYTQNRDGAATAVRNHTRGAPGSGGKGDTGSGRFYSPNGDDYYKSDGKVEKDRPAPGLKNPIADGKMRDGDSGHFDARRKNEKGYYQHGALDVLADPGTATSSVADGEVTAIGTSTSAKENGKEKQYNYVEVTTKDGYKVRQHYVKPTVKEGDTVKAGQQIGTVDNLSPRYGQDMPNHTHVEVYDTKTTVDNGKTGIKRHKRIDPALHMGLGK